MIKSLIASLITLTSLFIIQGFSMLPGSSSASFSLQPDAGLAAELEGYTINHGYPCPERFLSPGIQEAWLNDNQAMLFLTFPTYLCTEHHFLPVLLNKNNAWSAGALEEGRISKIVPLNDGLLVLAHWEIEGTYPTIYFYRGKEYIHLSPPEGRAKDCCFENISDFFVSEGYLYIQYYLENEEITGPTIWRLPINAITASTPHDDQWQALTNLPKVKSRPSVNQKWLPATITYSDSIDFLQADLDFDIERWRIKLPQFDNIEQYVDNLILNEDAQALETILSKQQDFAQIESQWSYSPLIRATQYDNLAIAKSLIDRVSNIDATDYDGNSALYYAVKNGNFKLTQHLLSKGANTDILGANSSTPLVSAIAQGNVEMVSLLLQHNANPDLLVYKSFSIRQLANRSVYKNKAAIIDLFKQYPDKNEL